MVAHLLIVTSVLANFQRQQRLIISSLCDLGIPKNYLGNFNREFGNMLHVCKINYQMTYGRTEKPSLQNRSEQRENGK